MLKNLSLNIFLEKRWKLIALLLLLLMFVLEISSALTESQIIDEGVHLTAGYSYLINRQIELNPEHPPLVKLISAAMVWPLHSVFPWHDLKDANQWDVAGKFFYDFGNQADLILFLGRLPIMFCSLLLGWLIFKWAKKISGVKAGLFALALFVFDSNILAHSRYITTDIAVSLGFLATLYYFCQYCEKPKTKNLFILLFIFAFAQITKFSTLILWPIIIIATFFSKLKARQAGKLIIGLMLATFWVVFIFYFGDINQYYEGLQLLADHEKYGHYTYLLGDYENYFRWYFPITFLVKTPLTTLLLILIAAVIFIAKNAHIRCLRLISLDKYLIFLFPILYFIISMINKINIGIRHLMPMYPFLFIFIAMVIFHPQFKNKIIKIISAALLLFFIIESMIIYPNYLGYFSLLVGGPSHGHKYILDSNLDWGQDLKKLKKYLARSNISQPIYLAYWGKASPDYYQINYLPLAPNIKKGLIAISMQNIMGEDKAYAWLLEKKPFAKIGSSIYLYYLQ